MKPTSNDSALWHWLNIALIAIAGLLAITSAFLQPPWCDEVAYVDPGAQLALTGHLRSSAWVTSSPLETWGSSNPGMPLLFAGWFKLVGVGQFQARLLFCLLHLTGIYCVFRLISRHLSPTSWALTTGILAALISPGFFYAIYRCRLEALGLLLCAWFLSYTWSSKDGKFVRGLSPFLLGITIIFFGLHFAGFFALAATAAFLIAPTRRTFLQGAALAVGLTTGMAVLAISYRELGTWESFIAARACHYGKILEWVPVGWSKFSVTWDLPIAGAISCAGLILSLYKAGHVDSSARLSWALGLTAFFLVPLFMNLVGIYYGNYCWMVALPMMLCLYHSFPKTKGVLRLAISFALSIILAFSALIQVATMPGAIADSSRRSQAVAALPPLLPRGALVAADFPFYYLLIEAGYQAYPRYEADAGLCLGYEQQRYFPEDLRQKIDCIIVRKGKADLALKGVGGEWAISVVIPARSGKTPLDDICVFLRK